ncbi:exonuclease domain-containing protein [Ferrimonas balearica]|uniref:exonuclease domain-containing protein n=1 Tax=Ferrimonas balearica TaxID=44012 RepID=UPI001C994155|nr:exonuclease domain-containing protein [Ferrimonas balearica]MBY5993957.1 3'-5' exonuclease [Ferrimonas balearica]
MSALAHRLKRLVAGWGALPEPLAPFFEAPAPKFSADYRSQSLLALDLELTGLDLRNDAILSIATVPIEGGRVQLSDAWHQLVAIDGEVGQSATIHGIHDRHLADGVPLCDALAALVPQLAGRVLVCHHGALDLGFLNAGLQHCFGQGLPLLAIDTLLLEQRRLERRGEVLKGDQLRLAQCRRRYGLPDYPGHHALVDAIACGELLLAQASALAGRQSLSLSALLKLSR